MFPSIHCEVYIRPSEDVTITEDSQDIEDPYPSTGRDTSSGAEPLNSAGVSRQKPRSAFVVQPPPQFETMDAAAVATLVALVMAMAGVSRALHIQGNLDKDDVLPGSEENLGDHLLRLVRP